ncbi:hypothetical protein [Sabulicella glaciei]|uniref:DUF4145 domain-containing protein n=1 Tax=Sabulicella glaciei TaxID=2984948 RepID=A0ABT3NXA7_9PROT|nr:hypothetical protein [Roseococcus sp. MDT2-1-1]MCW8086805.1 hypothetical protein [Roseococcus sp. MDT2-1-1]
MRFLDRFGRRPSAAPEKLGEFLLGQGAFVAQKTVLDYCRVKAGRNERAHFADPGFQAALEHCRWQVFLSALADVTLVAEAALRPHAPGAEDGLTQGLAALHDSALLAAAPPEAEREAAEGARLALPHHLSAAQAVSPLPPHRRPLLAEPVLFATLPVHPDQRRGEEEAIRGALRFHVVTTVQEMERRFDLPSLAAAVAGTAPRH